MKYLTVEQIKALLEAHNKMPERLLFRILYFTGCRVSEALSIRPKDIDTQRRIITVPALKIERKSKLVVVDGVTLAMLKVYTRGMDKDKLIFPYTRWHAWEIVRKAGKKVGIDGLHPHVLRHSFAVHWASAGGDLLKLQRQLGHKRLSTTTDTYIQYASEDIKKEYDKIFR